MVGSSFQPPVSFDCRPQTDECDASSGPRRLARDCYVFVTDFEAPSSYWHRRETSRPPCPGRYGCEPNTGEHLLMREKVLHRVVVCQECVLLGRFSDNVKLKHRGLRCAGCVQLRLKHSVPYHWLSQSFQRDAALHVATNLHSLSRKCKTFFSDSDLLLCFRIHILLCSHCQQTLVQPSCKAIGFIFPTLILLAFAGWLILSSRLTRTRPAALLDDAASCRSPALGEL